VTFFDSRTGSSRVESDPETIEQLENDPNYTVTHQEFTYEDTNGDDDHEDDEVDVPRDSSHLFLDQKLGLGVVRVFREMQGTVLTPGSQSMGTIVTQAGRGVVGGDAMAPGERRSARRREILRQSRAHDRAIRRTQGWQSRHGMTPDSANREFADLLVPGVGLAPVTEFQVLITLFVLVIGPLNYWLLRRAKRLHLLVLTVPLAAGLMTAALFAYAIVSDGFGTAARVHSLTLLDQRSGEATCWSRLSYYSGLAPGSGLTMPSDTAVYPIIPGWNDGDIDASIGAEREIVWEPGEARLTRGWLRSRTPTQYLTIRARQSPHRLSLALEADKLRAHNELGTTIEYVVAVDEVGKLYAGEKLPAGASTSLLLAKRIDVIRRLRTVFAENEPELPAALANRDSDFMILQQRQAQRMLRSQYGLQFSGELLKDNLMNDALSDLTGLEDNPALQLPPRSYVAITETGPEVSLGTSRAEEVASFHVLLGRW
jgi:hypothetical protein